MVKAALLSSRKVLVLKDLRGPIYKSLSLSLSFDHKVLGIFKDFAFCKLSVMYDHVTSINSVAATEHEDTVKNVLLTDVRYYLLIYCMSASKPFFTVTQCCCPRGPICKSLT